MDGSGLWLVFPGLPAATGLTCTGLATGFGLAELALETGLATGLTAALTGFATTLAAGLATGALAAGFADLADLAIAGLAAGLGEALVGLVVGLDMGSTRIAAKRAIIHALSSSFARKQPGEGLPFFGRKGAGARLGIHFFDLTMQGLLMQALNGIYENSLLFAFITRILLNPSG